MSANYALVPMACERCGQGVFLGGDALLSPLREFPLHTSRLHFLGRSVRLYGRDHRYAQDSGVRWTQLETTGHDPGEGPVSLHDLEWGLSRWTGFSY